MSLFLYGDIGWRDLPRLILSAFLTSATVMLVIGATGALAWLITVEQVAAQLAEWVGMVATEPWMFLALVNVALLLLGIFIEPLPALLLTAPLFLPLAQALKIDLVHLGVVMTANLAIASTRRRSAGRSSSPQSSRTPGFGDITKKIIPLFLASLVVLALITFVPALSSALWRLMM